MTLKSWKEEFYPIPAKSKEAKADAAAHSLRKWQGLTKANLKKHGLVPYAPPDGNFIEGIRERDNPKAKFRISGSNCSLCEKHTQRDFGPKCQRCSLALARADSGAWFTTCCVSREDEKLSPWGYWIFHGRSAPMIRWLKKAVTYEKKQAEKETK